MAFGSSAVVRAESTLAGIIDAYWHDGGLRSAAKAGSAERRRQTAIKRR
jgi:hypothetical protein